MSVQTKHTITSQPATRDPAAHLARQQVAMMPQVTDLISQVTRPRPGQPTRRTPQVIEAILNRIASGETLVGVCQDPGMPGYSTVHRWCREDAELMERVNEAYEWHARVLDDIVDDMLAGGVTSTGDFRRDEARAGHMRWRLGKLNRRRYGDKTQVDVVSHQVFVLPTDVIDGEGL